MKQKNMYRKGAAMLWAVLVMLMIAIISSGIIFVSRIYYVREQNENYQLQAQMYAESAIEIIGDDIVHHQTDDDYSKYVSADNSTRTYTFAFPDASNWNCTVTVSHSVVDMSEVPEITGESEDDKKNRQMLSQKKSGQIYLTARVTRRTSGGKVQLAEVCAKMSCDDSSKQWSFDGYYNL